MEYTEVAQFPSSSSSKIYTIKRDEDGNLSCDCPAWRFKKGDKPRTCKHVVEYEASPGWRWERETPVAEEVRPATDVVGGLLEDIEEHKEGKGGPDSLAEKMRRLDQEA